MYKKESRFAACHPAVTFAFFAAAIAGSVFFQHPAYLSVSVLAAAACLLSERGRKALPMLGGMVPLFVFLSAINPLFSTGGSRILFTVFGRPYTWEALLYGMVVSGMLAAALLWFSCYTHVMTSDKFTCLFGNLIPALSLVLVMILRLIPSYQRKARQIAGARRCMGKSTGEAGAFRERAENGAAILSGLTTWALEGAIITADSMGARGYGTASRSSFRICRWERTDLFLMLLIPALSALTLWGAALGWTAATFLPEIRIAPLSGIQLLGLAAYGLLLLIPAIMNALEELKWKYLRSGI